MGKFKGGGVKNLSKLKISGKGGGLTEYTPVQKAI